MKTLFLLALGLSSLVCFSQQKIKLEEIKDHVGDSVTVQGTITGIRFLESAKNTPTFINVGGQYPNQLLTIVIWGDVRNKLQYIPTYEKDKGSVARVSGKVEIYKDKPQIVIKDPKQLSIVEENIQPDN